MCVISIAGREMLPHRSFNVLFFFFSPNAVTLALLFQAFIVLDPASIQSLPFLLSLHNCLCTQFFIVMSAQCPLTLSV